MPHAHRNVAFVLASSDHAAMIVNRLLLDLRRHYHGAGVIAVDCEANIGVYAVE